MRDRGRDHGDHDNLFRHASQLIEYGEELAGVGQKWEKRLKVLYALYCEQNPRPRPESDNKG
jgi:anti-sigma-K factor RskA